MRLPVTLNNKLDLILGASCVRLSPAQALRLSERLIVAGSRALVDETIRDQQALRRPMASPIKDGPRRWRRRCVREAVRHDLSTPSTPSSRFVAPKHEAEDA